MMIGPSKRKPDTLKPVNGTANPEVSVQSGRRQFSAGRRAASSRPLVSPQIAAAGDTTAPPTTIGKPVSSKVTTNKSSKEPAATATVARVLAVQYWGAHGAPSSLSPTAAAYFVTFHR
ncbi:hypothetical protein EPH_0027890 [Eimeria praecox]|uniref:Uncharacterized protein n=1 Tax=Eimeria praecox TaxID=51316 RepID=U6G2L0_9EIME|nr:hypothetical protein EPH_0027890 [Eimeria praecox]